MLNEAVKQSIALRLFGMDCSEVDHFIKVVWNATKVVENNRYFRREKYKKRTPKFDLYLDPTLDDAITDTEFLFHFRVSRPTFMQLVRLLQDHPAFSKNTKDGPDCKPAANRLLVLMKYYGTEGNQSSSVALGHFFGISVGAVHHCRDSALVALKSLKSQTYFWPSSEERKRMSARIKARWMFPYCVGLIDGTLLPLSSRPLLFGENYMSRKKFYAIVMLIVWDDIGRILYYNVGWPGSVHDNQVWRTCKMNVNSQDFFSPKEYLLGDSAFTAGPTMIPPFKSKVGTDLDMNSAQFNTMLARPRVKSEHCIGILKGRFPFFKSIPIKFGTKRQFRRIVDYVLGGVILHNFLLQEPVEKTWLNNHEQDDYLDPAAQPANNDGCNYQRRNEIMLYLSQLEDTNIH